MPKIVDKVINVPIYDADIENTITSLPRMPSEASIVEVELKRKIEMKNTHAHAYIRPVATINAAKKLKEQEEIVLCYQYFCDGSETI